MGTVGLWHADDQPPHEVYLVGMWVATVARGTDVATQLVGTALTHAAASGWRRVLLDVAHENGRARAFYARMGFRPTGEVDTHAVGPHGHRGDPRARPARRRLKFTLSGCPALQGSWESGGHE